MSNWNNCSIGDLGLIVGGATPSSKNKNNYLNGNISWITPKDLSKSNSRYISKGERNITEEGLNSCSSKLLPKGSVLFSSRAPIGYVGIAQNELCTNQGFKSIVPNRNNDSLFIYYLLKFYAPKIEKSASGSTFKEISGSDLKAFKVRVPNITIQKNIAGVLNAIDLKIENNNKINAELESLAKTIYDYWFLQFEFPNEEGKPYKSSGGKIVWNEDLKREIPEGWKTATLDKVISVSNERISSKEIGDRLYVPIECIPRKQMSFYETADIEKAATGLCPFDENSILISNRRVYFHKVSITPFKGVTRDTVIIVNPLDKNNLGYVFQLLFSDHFISFATLNSYGTEQPVFSPTSFSQYRITIPNNSLDIEYSKKVKPIINRILENQRENKKLSSLRDFLLPMLMNGQVQFK